MSFTSPLLDRLKAIRAQTPSAAPPPVPEPAQRSGVPSPLPAPSPRPAPPPRVPSKPPAPVKVPGQPHAPLRAAQDTPRRALTLDGLPPALARMVEQAQRGTLPGGVHLLESGLVMDVNGYVLAWAEHWPSDPPHILKRLTEALDVLRQA